MVYYRRKSTRSYGRKKRWYVNAGANLPFVGKTNVSFGTTKRARSLNATIKKVVRNTTAPKSYEEDILNTFTGGLKNNTIFTTNLSGQIVQGTDDDDRIGDVIHLKYLSMKGRLSQTLTDATERHYPTWWRFLLIKSDKEYTTGNAFGTGFGGTDLFKPYSTGSQLIYIPIDRQNVTVLKQWEYKMQSNTTLNSHTKICDLSTKLDMTIKFKDGTIFGKNNNLYLVVIFSNVNKATSDAIADSGLDLAWHVDFSDTK